MHLKDIAKIKKIMVFGTFDILHKGHINFFEQAKSLGEELIVVIARDINVKRIKGDFPRFSELERLNSVKREKIVNLAILGDLEDRYRAIKDHKPEIICLGYDQGVKEAELQNDLLIFNIKPKIIRLKSYKPEIYKSSLLKKNEFNKRTIKSDQEVC